MRRTLFFYDLILEKNNQLNIFQDSKSTLESKVSDFVSNHSQEDLLYIKGSNVVQIEDIADNYIFGSYGKIEKLSERLWTRGRTEEDMEITDLESIKELIESFTYFYLDLTEKDCIVLNNPRSPGFKTELPQFLLHHFRTSGIYKDIKIVSKLSDSIEQEIGRAKEFAKISYTYTSDKIPENEFLGFKEVSGVKDNQIKTAAVQLYFESESDFSEVSRNLSKTDEYIDSFDSLKIETYNETIDVIDKILTKKVSIPLDEDESENVDEIKSILIEYIASSR